MTSHDDDMDFDALKSAMQAATPAADPARRAENLALAQKNFENLQGSRSEARHNSERPKKRGVFKGVIEMILAKRTAAGLTATTAIVAVGFIAFMPQLQEMRRDFRAEAPEIVEPVLITGEESEGRVQESTATVSPGTDLDAAPEQQGAVDPAVIPADLGTVTAGEAESGPELEVAEAPFEPPLVFPQGQLLSPAPQPTQNGGVMSLYSGVPTATAQDGMFAGNANTRTVGGIVAAEPVIVQESLDSEEFANEDDNPVRVVAEDPVSTFSIDVDTASYSIVRSSLNRGQLPNPDAVRIEEMINYFPYDYEAPSADEVSPFRPTVNVFETPWNPDTRLVHIGLQGEMPAIEDRPALNLVFLIDTSGSMNDPSKLPLLIQSFRLMLDRLDPEDQVAIVTYAGSAGVALEPTSAADRDAINAALSSLQAGGSTNGVGGLQVAYGLANQMTDEGEVSRVLLATDGDFNVGISDPDRLTDFIESQRDSGTYLSVLGFGRGNLQDDTMQALAQNGNGTAAYIDTLHEAQRVLVDQLAGALFPIADDVKVQVEFNPAVIAEYRLIGYETRALEREDFNNDDVDAGELGAGHNVTAIYEVTPVGSPARLTDPLRYGDAEPAAAAQDLSGELGFLRLRWKEPGAEESELIEFPIVDSDTTNPEAQFAAAMAGFGQLLRGNDFLGDWDYADAIALATENRGEDEFGYRNEAVQLMRLAESLSSN